MTEAVPFADDVRDLSDSDGYQLEFACERCGNGYRSAFQRDLRGRVPPVPRLRRRGVRRLARAERTCRSRAATVPASARFCSECGTPSGA